MAATSAASGSVVTSLYTVKSVLVLDTEGKRILAKYYGNDFATVKEQLAFEKNLFEKTKRYPAGEIVMFDGLISVYRNAIDVFFYVIGSAKENELILAHVLSTFMEALALLFRNQVEKRTILENYDALVLTLDELIDDGIILEADATQIATRVSMKGPDGGPAEGAFAEQTLQQALSTAKSLGRSLLK